MAKHLGMAPKEGESLTDPVHQKIVYGKTSIQKKIIGEKIFCGKFTFRVIEASDASCWKVY